MMDDDLIPDEGFELGMPSLTDMLRHQCELLQPDEAASKMVYQYGDHFLVRSGSEESIASSPRSREAH